MKTENEFHPVIIKCAECNTVQAAIVEQMFIWNSSVHKCTGCGAMITESDWQEIKPFVKL